MLYKCIKTFAPAELLFILNEDKEWFVTINNKYVITHNILLPYNYTTFLHGRKETYIRDPNINIPTYTFDNKVITYAEAPTEIRRKIVKATIESDSTYVLTGNVLCELVDKAK